MLATIIEKGWLPNGIGTGAFDAYGNSRRYYFRAAVFHLAKTAPERLAPWLASEGVTFWCTSSTDRETLRMAKKLMR